MLAIRSGSATDRKHLPPNAKRALMALAATGMVVALFWITNIYAADLGKRDADFDAQKLWANEKSVQLDTAEVLSPPSRLVKTSLLPSAGGSTTPTYRYECLRVIEVRNGHYVLLPAKWTRESGWAVVVTPDSTHRINGLVNVGLAGTTGGGANVAPFWQCPEVVRSFLESDLDQMLASTDEISRVLDTKALAVYPSDRPASTVIDQNGASSANDCSAQENPVESTPALPRYPGDGVTTRAVEMAGAGTSGSVWVRQRVARFPNPATAQAFLDSTQQRWGFCARQVVTVDREGLVEPCTLAPPGIQQDILTVQVDVCGAEQPLLAAVWLRRYGSKFRCKEQLFGATTVVRRRLASRDKEVLEDIAIRSRSQRRE